MNFLEKYFLHRKNDLLFLCAFIIVMAFFSSYSVGCSQQKNQSRISKEIAFKICKEQLSRMEANPDEYEIKISKDSLPIDILETYIPPNDPRWQKPWLKILKLLEKIDYWTCSCKRGMEIDGIHEIYIDAHSGAILYVDGVISDSLEHIEPKK